MNVVCSLWFVERKYSIQRIFPHSTCVVCVSAILFRLNLIYLFQHGFPILSHFLFWLFSVFPREDEFNSVFYIETMSKMIPQYTSTTAGLTGSSC